MLKAAVNGRNKDTNGDAIRITGLNDNLEFMGKQLHVQTENAGFPAVHIVTQVFCRGKVILSRKMEYPAGVRETGDADKMQELMRIQHFQIIKDIEDKQTRLLASH
jgi:hypothetical protein